MSGPRRLVLRSIAGITIAAGLARLGLGSTAATTPKKKRRRRRRRKPMQRNAYGCVNVGGACRGLDANCCSGHCEGPVPKGGTKDTSRCVAHNELDCAPGADNCQALAQCGPGGFCYQTTGEASFCGVNPACFDCKQDADCEPDFGPGAACIVCDNCNGTLCAPPSV